MRRLPLVGFALLAAPIAHAYTAVIVTADGRPAVGASATIVVAQDGPQVVVSAAFALPGKAKAAAVLIPLPGARTPPQLGPFDLAALDRLLAETAPRIVPRADPDPCFPHPPLPPPPAERANDSVPGEAGRSDYAVFKAADRGMADWLAERGLPSAAAVAAMSRWPVPILALGFPIAPGTAAAAPSVASVQLRYDAPQVTLTMLPDDSDITVLTLTRHGRMEPANLGNRRVPAGVDVPEFVLDQFAHFYAAVLGHQADGALTEFAGVSTSADLAALGAGWAAPAEVFITRLHLRPAEAVTLRETADVTPFRAEYRARIGWKGQYTLACSAGFDYRHAITARWQDENATLAGLTGWHREDIRNAMVAHWQRTREHPPTE